jgi:hypothetical protein
MGAKECQRIISGGLVIKTRSFGQGSPRYQAYRAAYYWFLLVPAVMHGCMMPCAVIEKFEFPFEVFLCPSASPVIDKRDKEGS